MRVLVCGSRHFKDKNLMEKILKQWNITAIIEGEAKGADTLARQWAEENNICVIKFPADWDKYGKAAGMIRNSQMIKEGKPDLVVAFLFPNSRGTKHMISIAEKAQIEVYVVNCE